MATAIVPLAQWRKLMRDIAILFTAEAVSVDSLSVMDALRHRFNYIARSRLNAPPEPPVAVCVRTATRTDNWFIELAAVPTDGRGTNVLLRRAEVAAQLSRPIQYIHLVLLNGNVSTYQGFGCIAEELAGSDDGRRIIADEGWRQLGFSL